MRFISCATVLDKSWLGLHLKTYRELSMKNLEMAQGRHSALRCGLTYNKSVVNNVKSVRKGWFIAEDGWLGPTDNMSFFLKGE